MHWRDFLTLSMEPRFRLEARARLIEENGHFLPTTKTSRIACIKRDGLTVQTVSGRNPPSWVAAAGFSNRLLFIAPEGSQGRIEIEGANELLLIPRDALPQVIGLDWTFSDFATLRYHFESQEPNDPVAFAVDCMKEWCSILCYDGVAPTSLRRWTGARDTLNTPPAWPLLSGDTL